MKPRIFRIARHRDARSRRRCVNASKTAVVLSALALATTAVSEAAYPTPFINVMESWSVRFVEYDNFPNPPVSTLPAGIVLSCFGDAVGSGSICLESLQLRPDPATLTFPQDFSASSSGGIVVTNTSGQTYPGRLVLVATWAAAAPGGNGIVLRIDDPLTQWESFSSGMSGPGPVGDAQGCSIGFRGYGGPVFSPTTCGEASPDFSQDDFIVPLGSLEPGQSVSFVSFIGEQASFDIVSEPTTATIVVSALAGLAIVLRRRRSSAFTSERVTDRRKATGSMRLP
jgi:hypothetical protein